MGKTEGWRHRYLLLCPIEQRIEAIVAVGLQDTGELGQMSLRMFATPVAGGVEDSSRRRVPSKGPVVANVSPYAAGNALPLGQDRDGRVVAVEALRRKHVGFDHIEEWLDGGADVANLVGERLGRQINPLAAEPATLAVQGLMLGEFVEDDGGKKVGAKEAARRGMERRRRLADAAALPAGKFLPDGFEDLEAAWDLLQRLGSILTKLRQTLAATMGAGGRRVDDNALALDILWSRLAHWSLAGEGTNGLCFR